MISVENQILKNQDFIDLFSGIGGFHIALNSFGANCVFASEWDKFASETYFENFNIKPFGDITKIREEKIPSHDILCGGFPCQAFSIAGKQKGFEDTRGTLFFDIARIINYHKPKVVFLENVKNLTKHDNGNTFKTIINSLANLEYTVYTKVLNASDFGLPQNRERIYFVCFRNDIDSSTFKFPNSQKHQICLEEILEENPLNAKVINRNDIEIYKDFKIEKSLFDEIILPNKPIQIGIVNKGGQGERIYHPLGHAITLSANGGGVGSKTGLYKINNAIRKLSPRECARVQGFPDSFILNKNDSQSYKQFGNSVAINVLQFILKEIADVIELHDKKFSNQSRQYIYG